MTRLYLRPTGFGDGVKLAGGLVRFEQVELIRREGAVITRERVTLDQAAKIAPLLLARLTAPRAAIASISFDRPSVMGILNVTPDSFSDGGAHADPAVAADAMLAAGAAIVDVGGESTRPGAIPVALDEELARVMPVLDALRGASLSIDTRKAAVMAAALDAGVALINDVSALTFDAAALALVAARRCPVVLMHAQGTPQTMQATPHYDDVLLDVYDWLEARIDVCVAAGIDHARVIVDPGIGFGKTLAHNLALLRGVGLFHGLGCPILLGVSRKAMIGTLAGGVVVGERLPGSLALALHGLGQGVQLLRVHDVAATVQAVRMWEALL